MSEPIICPKCKSELTFNMDGEMFCSQCFHQWDPNEEWVENEILDSNGAVLNNGDTVQVIKDLPVKGFPKSIKAGTKIKNVRLRPDSDHNIDCKVDGFGAMALKSEFLKKV
ncbi:zinc ribbon domain-containing protein YjdM [Halpernia frigidisoli]|uniref:Phosphonoacetate hydrolase n=1 Tax=Halpernia frigidisoli TaxID=1125876 RepID=A0A1I3ED23_9FLAO|nr:zinc ribbon domain-containing protein YjdM [Halpernia frigidisoli]SFH96753.1 phosphonoacetate hydrolase [Halpernia frigidisoli]